MAEYIFEKVKDNDEKEDIAAALYTINGVVAMARELMEEVEE